jgi:hypothetical protein
VSINRSVVTIIAALFATLFTVPGYSQQDATEDRTQCVRKCRFRFGSDLWGGGGGGTSQQLYYQCLTHCDNKFWAEFDKEIDNNEFKN